MKKRILAYVKRIDAALNENDPGGTWEELLQEHLTQIAFFQHERLIHLLVTLTFAILAVATILVELISEYTPLLILFALLLVLLVPYIKHYYLLENKTQYMYEQYDEMLKKAKEEKEKTK